MLIAEPLPFIKDYVREMNTAIKAHCPEKNLSRIQQYWLSFCIMAIMVTNSVCWARFQKASIGQYRIGALVEIPLQIGHRFRFKSATDSAANRPPIPLQIGRAFRFKLATPWRGEVTLDN
jgi:hypothetical protein